MKTINETILFSKYKSSYSAAFGDLVVHISCLSSAFYLLWYYRNSWLAVLTIPLLAFMNDRNFIVFHDCGHNTYSPNKMLNYILGNLFGIFVFTPMCWNWHHGNHHLTSSNTTNKLNHKYNETVYHSLYQYKQFSGFTQTLYKISRHPIVFFTLLPILYFVIKQRTDVLRYKLNKKRPYTQSVIQILFETLFSNIGIAIFVYYLCVYEIIQQYCVVLFISSLLLTFTFHNQHTFNPSYVVNNEKWTQRNSGLVGSSLILYPNLFKYFSMGIEYHHIHHMNAKIPGYNLQAYHEEVISKSNIFDNVVKLTMTDCYNNLWLVLYDEENKKYITFMEADYEITN